MLAVLKWIRKAAYDLPNYKDDFKPVEIIMLDEIWYVVKEKKKIWIWRPIDGISHKFFKGQIGTPGDCTVKKLIDRVDNGVCSFVTDEWPGFFPLLPEDRHV